jgi:hypothetical protein
MYVSPEDGNRSSFQKGVLFKISDDGQGPKMQKFQMKFTASN